MTSWNPRNHVYTGDPSPRPTGGTDLGVGYAGNGASSALPARNPIGFAPAADLSRAFALRSRSSVTKLPSRRSRAPMSRAALATSSNPVPSTSVGTRRQTRRRPTFRLRPPSRTTLPRLSSPSRDDEPAADAGQADSEPKVPFYKRELSFRRRKTDVEPVPVVADVAAEPVFDEPAAEEIVTEEPLAEAVRSRAPFRKSRSSSRLLSRSLWRFELVPHVPVAEEPFVEPVDESPSSRACRIESLTSSWMSR